MLKRFGLGLGIGYILGARAGERRYEQLAGAARRAAEAAGLDELLDKVPEVARDGAGRAIESLKERARATIDGEDDEEEGEHEDEDEDEGGEEPRDETEPEDDSRDRPAKPKARPRRQQAGGRAEERGRSKEGGAGRRPEGSDRPRRSGQASRSGQGQGGQGSQKRRSLVSSVAEIASTAMERGKVA